MICEGPPDWVAASGGPSPVVRPPSVQDRRETTRDDGWSSGERERERQPSIPSYMLHCSSWSLLCTKLETGDAGREAQSPVSSCETVVLGYRLKLVQPVLQPNCTNNSSRPSQQSPER